MRDQYKKKSEEIQVKYNACFEELSSILMDKVGIDQIKKDRDERIRQLRDEFDDLNDKHDKLMKDYSQQHVKLNTLQEKYDQLVKDHDVMILNLTEAIAEEHKEDEKLTNLQNKQS